MTAIDSLLGSLYVELTSADMQGLMNRICDKGLRLRDISSVNDLAICFRISRNEYAKLQLLVDRQGGNLRLLGKEGVFWNISRLLARPLFLGGMLLLLLMGIFLPGRVFFVKVQGNERIETSCILETASDCGISFGSSRRKIKSEQVKNQLLYAIPDLQWIGVNTKGCVAIISVRECTVQEPLFEKSEPCNIVALRDGIVLNCAATQGVLLCKDGQAVTEGEILISGQRDVGGISTFTGASGEVFASTQRQLSVVIPVLAMNRGVQSGQRVKYSLQIGKKLINFFKGSGISGSTCVKMYSKYVLTLPGGFTLPVALVKWAIDSWDVVAKKASEDEVQSRLTDFASSYLKDQMIAGAIIQKDESVAQLDGIYQLTGTYACTEMIGRVQKEQIGAYNGKTD